MDNVERVLPNNKSLDGAIAAIADVQCGVFSRGQALGAGFTPRQIQLRIESRRWDVRHRGVYRLVGASASLQQSAMAGALYAGDGALVSHGTAGVLWGIEGVRAPKIELWVTKKRSEVAGLALHRGTRLDRADRTRLGAIPITTAVRTLIDLSARLEDDPLLAAVESAFKAKLCTPERLATHVEILRASGRPGAGRLAEILAGRSGPALESVLEAKVWRLIQRTALPLPQRQFWVSLPGGRFRLDFAWPEHRVGLECDGWEHHGTRTAFDPDRARLAEFAAARWSILPVTWKVCTQAPERVERWLRRVLVPVA